MYLHCGDVLSREGIGGIADEQASLTHSSGQKDTKWKNRLNLMFSLRMTVLPNLLDSIFCNLYTGHQSKT